MHYSQWFSIVFILFCVHKITTLTLPQCEILNATKTDKDYWLEIRSGSPRILNDRPGSVYINATVMGEHRTSEECSWTLDVNGVVEIQHCTNFSETISLPWYFRKPGLKVIKATATFTVEDGLFSQSDHTVQNCTTINVTDCSGKLQMVVSTPKKTFNVSKNQSKLVLDSPGQVNFTISLLHITDPFHVCHEFFYNWNFGDGVMYLDISKGNLTTHHYNTSGTFNMSLGLYAQAKSLQNVSLTIFVKEPKHHKTPNHAAAIDVSLVLVICVTGLVLLICFVVMRKRVQRFTEVASFDFRHKDFQSEDGRVFCKPRFVQKFMRRQQNEEQLLLPKRFNNSSQRSFGSTSLHEDL